MNNASKSFDILAISFNVLHNYFDGPTKFLDLYLTKFLNILAQNCPFCTEELRIIIKSESAIDNVFLLKNKTLCFFKHVFNASYTLY